MGKKASNNKVFSKITIIIFFLSLISLFIFSTSSFSIPLCITGGSAPTVGGTLTLNTCQCWPANTHDTPYVFTSLTIGSGGELTVCNNQTGQLFIEVQGTFTNSGTIDLSARDNFLNPSFVSSWLWAKNLGLLSNETNGIDPPNPDASFLFRGNGGTIVDAVASPGAPGSTGNQGGNGAKFLEQGSQGSTGGSGGSGGNGAYKNATDVASGPGGAGGSGGIGGLGGLPSGILHIRAKEFINNGNIYLNGQNGKDGLIGSPGIAGSGAGIDGTSTTGGVGGTAGNGGASGNAAVACEAQDDAVGGGGGGGSGGFGAAGGGGSAGLLIVLAQKATFSTTATNQNLTGGNGAAIKPAITGRNGATTIVNSSSCVFDSVYAFGGGGGGAGGPGGAGGNGSSGHVILQISDTCTNCSAANFNTNPAYIHHNSVITTPIKAKFGEIGILYSTTAPSPMLVENIEYVSGWINNKGMRKVQTTAANWFYINNINIGESNLNKYPFHYKINQAYYDFFVEKDNADVLVTSALAKPFKMNSNDFDSTTIPALNQFSFLNSQTGGNLISNTNIKLFDFTDGIVKVRVTARTTGFLGAANAPIPLNSDDAGLFETVATPANYFPVLIDQYAPCDNSNPQLHLCSISIHDSTDDSLLNLGTSNGKLRVKFQAIEGDGSGIFADGSDDNVRLFLAKQQESTTSYLSMPTTPTYGNVFDFSNVKDKDCGEIITAGFGTATPYPIPPSLTYYNPDTSGYMNIDIDMSGTTFTEGTYWVFICLKDRAGNWSLFYDPPTSTILSSPENFLGFPNGTTTTISTFNINDPTFNNFSTPDKMFVGHLPPLHKRFIYDKGDPDVTTLADSTTCISDPCNSLILSPTVSFIDSGETDIRLAFSPPDFTSASKVKVGIKLPPDTSGIKGIYYKVSTVLPVTNSEGLFIPIEDNDLSMCSDIINVNNAQDTGTRPAQWVDFCFEINTLPGADVIIWLQDASSNNNLENSKNTFFVKRRLLIDNIPPSIPKNFGSFPNPTTSFTPTVTFSPSSDNYQLKGYRICYWEKYAGFTQTDLANLPLGLCPQSYQIGGRKAFTSDEIPKDANSIKTFTFPGNSGLLNGSWNMVIFAIDVANNPSNFSSLYELVISDGKSFINFSKTSVDYELGGVSPNTGTTGFYNFQINYTDLGNLAPTKPIVWVDVNGDGTFNDSEAFNMIPDSSITENDGTFTNGETFSRSLHISYSSTSKGKVKYKFEFSNQNGYASKGVLSGNPTNENIFQMDPYDNSTTNRMIEVRNNYIKRDSTLLPVILLRNPGDDNIKISCGIYDTYGNLVKKLVQSSSYASLERYLSWDLTDNSNRPVPNGLYRAVYRYKGKYKFDNIIILR